MSETSGSCRRFGRFFPALLYALCVHPAAADADTEKRIASNLRAVFPDVEVTRIIESRVPGLYEVMLGPEVIYISGDGRYVLQGDLIDLQQRRNLSEERRSVARWDLLRNVPASEMIEFAPSNTEHAVYVFTDISCGFCRKMHREMPELNRLGIAVRYLAFPRSGTNGAVFREMVSVWCASDRRQALTDAKLGKPIKQADCANPVEKHFRLGQALGVHGTPAIYLENGRAIGGYHSPRELLEVVRKD